MKAMLDPITTMLYTVLDMVERAGGVDITAERFTSYSYGISWPTVGTAKVLWRSSEKEHSSNCVCIRIQLQNGHYEVQLEYHSARNDVFLVKETVDVDSINTSLYRGKLGSFLKQHILHDEETSTD